MGRFEVETRQILAIRMSHYMARDHQHNPDPNVNAARIVRDSTRGDD
jgi:hypothetical protein